MLEQDTNYSDLDRDFSWGCKRSEPKAPETMTIRSWKFRIILRECLDVRLASSKCRPFGESCLGELLGFGSQAGYPQSARRVLFEAQAMSRVVHSTWGVVTSLTFGLHATSLGSDYEDFPASNHMKSPLIAAS